MANLDKIRVNGTDYNIVDIRVRDLAVSALPDGGVIESGKTYGSPTSPISAPSVINGTGVTNESVVYYTVASGQTINYVKRLNDVPTEVGATAVVSFESGVAVFGTITD